MSSRAFTPGSLGDWYTRTYAQLPPGASETFNPNPFRPSSSKPTSLKGSPGGKEILEKNRVRQPVPAPAGAPGQGNPTGLRYGGRDFAKPQGPERELPSGAISAGGINPFRAMPMPSREAPQIPSPARQDPLSPPALPNPFRPALPLDQGRPEGAMRPAVQI